MKDASYFVWTACYRSYCPGTLFMSALWAIRYGIDITFKDSNKGRSWFWFFCRSIKFICRLTNFHRSVCFPRSRARNLSTRLLVTHRGGLCWYLLSSHFCQPNYHHLDFLKAVMAMPQFFNYQVSVWKEIFKSDIFVILGVTMRRVLVRLLSYCWRQLTFCNGVIRGVFRLFVVLTLYSGC